MALTNSQYDEIMRAYNQTKLRHVREQELRIQEIYRRIPAIREMDRETAMLAAGQARKLLSGDRQSLKELKYRLADIKAQKKALLLGHGYAADAMEIQYDCNLCRDTGYAAGKKCRCFRQKEIDLLYHQSNLRQILLEENFDTFSYEWYDNTALDGKRSPRANMRYVVQVCRDMIENFADVKKNLLITGNTGTGKTFLTHCIARELLNACYSVIYLSSSELFDIFSTHQFQDTPESEEDMMYAHIYNCDLLIIDDLGSEVANTFTMSKLFTCINERCRNNRSVIISSNLDIRQIYDIYSERIASRLLSNYERLELYGDDIRIKKKRAAGRRFSI